MRKIFGVISITPFVISLVLYLMWFFSHAGDLFSDRVIYLIAVILSFMVMITSILSNYALRIIG
ncbi:hypothetical protein [Terrilactibacillus laevilacticus]|uniref:Uncharacterized protein n=1 Tax=Terrilactibacillus laevilacticus TaxID=1380157 RepID=A0ABW5PSK7_9BACI|nr:hypothetical protein [Terrilactibacillus laevilacticus]